MKPKNLSLSSPPAVWRVLLLLVLAWLGVTLAASAGDFHQDFNRTLPLSADGSFSLDNVNGAIMITGWDKDEVQVSAAKHGDNQTEVEAVQIDVQAEASRIVVHTQYPVGHDKSDVAVAYTIRVPVHAHLAKIEAVNGAVNIAGVRGDIKASTVNGEIRIDDAAANLKLETVNGRISADLIRLQAGQKVSCDTVNGQIRVSLPVDGDATVSAETVNGAISSDFSSLEVTRDFPLGTRLKGQLGDGGARVHANTVNGAILFEQGEKARNGGAGSAMIRSNSPLKPGMANSLAAFGKQNQPPQLGT